MFALLSSVIPSHPYQTLHTSRKTENEDLNLIRLIVEFSESLLQLPSQVLHVQVKAESMGVSWDQTPQENQHTRALHNAPDTLLVPDTNKDVSSEQILNRTHTSDSLVAIANAVSFGENSKKSCTELIISQFYTLLSIYQAPRVSSMQPNCFISWHASGEMVVVRKEEWVWKFLVQVSIFQVMTWRCTRTTGINLFSKPLHALQLSTQ